MFAVIILIHAISLSAELLHNVTYAIFYSLCYISFFVLTALLQTVTVEEGETLAREYNIHFFETSAKQDMNVEKSFITIATDVKDRLMVDGGSSGASSGSFMFCTYIPSLSSCPAIEIMIIINHFIAIISPLSLL